MKSLQKFILPGLLILFVILVYTIYFAPKKGLGSFDDFDANHSAVKDIKVALVLEKGIERNPQGGALFYASDKNNTTVSVNADKVPDGIEAAKIVILRGHLNQNNSFHAHDVLLTD
jgi:cytochrome c-type biogenesis protein CcmE